MNLKNIGENIKRLRAEMGYTQAQLAELADISTVHMSHIETGSVAMSLECLIRISNGLNTTPDAILFGEYEITSSSGGGVMPDYLNGLTSDENRLIAGIAKLIKDIEVNK